VRDSSRWHLTDFQRLMVVLAILSAMFLSAMSWGKEDAALLLVALVLVVAAGLGVFMLGLRYNGRVGMHGNAYVIVAQEPPAGKIVGRCDMRVLVELPGRPSTMMKFRAHSVPVVKWPRPGMVLPVEIAPRNARQLRVRWELVEPHHSRASSQAEEAAAFAVPFFTDYAEGALGPDFRPSSTSPTRATSLMNDATPPVVAHTLDEGFPPAPGLEADPESAARATEANARTTEFDLPSRSIPQPRPAERPVMRGSDDEAQAMGIMLVVSDLNRSLHFYRDALDFAVVDRASGSAVLSYVGGRVLLRQVVDMSPADRKVVRLYLPVPDVEAAHQDLRSKGVEFDHRPRRMSHGDRLELWTATFCDPDGNAISLTQWRDREETPPHS